MDSRVYVDIRTPRKQFKLAERRLEGHKLPGPETVLHELACSMSSIRTCNVLGLHVSNASKIGNDVSMMEEDSPIIGRV